MAPLNRSLRRAAGRVADAIADRVVARLPAPGADPARTAPAVPPAGTHITLDYAVHPRARYGFGQPPHPQLTALLARDRDRYRRHLETILAHAEQLQRIEPLPRAGTEPAWVNDYIPGLDGAALYAFVADRRSNRYLEIGSGNSTRFVRRAIRDNALATRIVSIDPAPRADVDDLCDEVIRAPLEEADLGVVATLRAGDVVFVDNSHRLLPNSDATVVFLDLLPRLPPGVLIGLHDIFLPEDYPPDWSDRFYSEQYALATFLLGGHAGYRVELPAWYVSHDPEFAALTASLWERPGLSAVQRHGGTFWMSTLDD